MMKALLAVFAFAVLITGSARAEDDATQLIRQGIDAYTQAQALTERSARSAAFARAGQLFEEAARRGAANADVHANAGTAALQAERLGPAILALRRALAADPDHQRALRNLAHARTLLPAWVPRPQDESILDTFFFWHRSMSMSERAGAGAACALLAALLLATAMAFGSRLARGLAMLPALAWIGLTLSLAVEAGSDSGRLAVVTAEETLARASDSANAPARFAEPLPGGTEVTVMETRSRWARIRLANDLEAWVSTGALARVDGPHLSNLP